MSLRDRIEKVKTQTVTCSVGLFMETLTEEQREEFIELCESDELSSILAKAVNAEYGVTIAGQTVARHRRRECKCP